VVEKIARALNRRGKPINGSRVLLLGVAYKEDVADERESPALKIFELLEEAGACVQYYDPYVPVVKPHTFFAREIRSVAPLTAERVRSQDVVVITTAHRVVDYQWVVDQAALVVDTRNATKHVERGREKILLL
jgi:UDP-N-acetyl-D-glucosamine dehydrogenase